MIYGILDGKNWHHAKKVTFQLGDTGHYNGKICFKITSSLKLIVGLPGSRGSLSGLGGGGGDIATLLGLLSALSQAIDLVLAVLLDEGDKVLDGARTVVLNRLILLASRVELDGGEASDGVGHIVGSGIDLGDDDLLLEVGNVGVQGGELIVLGSKTGTQC